MPETISEEKSWKAKLSYAQRKLKQLEEKLKHEEKIRKHLAADFANFEKRTVSDQAKIRTLAAHNLLEKLFPVFDNFYRASSHAPNVKLEDMTKLTDDELKKIATYFDGLKMIEGQMENILAEAGLKRILTKNHHFDPNLHEAVSYETHTDVPAETIIDEIEAGWQLDDKVIKPAKVRVSKG